MAIVDLVMPKLGESIMEATVLKWHKQPGDSIKMDETLLDIATDKVDSEVPSTTAGTIEEILFSVNDVVPIGTVIARIKTATGTEDPQVTSISPVSHANEKIQEAEVIETKQNTNVSYGTVQAPVNTAGRFYSPLVLNIAASEGVSMSELERIPGTGAEGRVTKKDILMYVSQGKSAVGNNSGQEPFSFDLDDVETGQDKKEETKQASKKETVNVTDAVVATTTPQTTTPPPLTTAGSSSAGGQLTSYQGNVEIIEMDRMRKLIADHMVRSKHTSPHVTSFTEADVTNLVQWRDRVKKEFEKREGAKITFTPLFIEAIVRCIKRFPLINSSLDGYNIIVKKDINIGMATALPSGNLIVPL